MHVIFDIQLLIHLLVFLVLLLAYILNDLRKELGVAPQFRHSSRTKHKLELLIHTYSTGTMLACSKRTTYHISASHELSGWGVIKCLSKKK
jgi:hypothetical protein